MRIAMVDPSLFTIPYDKSLCAGLASLEHGVHLFGRATRRGEQWSCDGVPLHPAFPDQPPNLPRPVRLALKGVRHARAMAALAPDLGALRPDVIHFQWMPLPSVDRWLLPRLRRVAPLVLTVHDSKPFNGNPSSFAQRLGSLSIYRQFDRLIVHTRLAVERLTALGVPPQHIVMMPHGLLPTSGPAASAPPRTMPESPTFVLFGKVKPYKGADIFLHAVSAMPEEVRRRCRFVVAGEPQMDVEPLRAFVRQHGLEEPVTLDFRYFSEEEMAALLAGATALVFPYRDIDASGVLLASLGIGKPVVASKVGLFAEILTDGVQGRLVPPEEPDALAGAMTALARSPEDCRRMGEAALATGSAIPDWTEIARSTVDQVYQRAIDGRAGAVHPILPGGTRREWEK